jgi:xanthine dehydrogenase accessory factor
MKELKDIILAYDKAVADNKKAVLATVVKVQGSSYRRPGARMLITEDGRMTGAISGGCLEGDALLKAQHAIFQQQNKLEIYETTDEEDRRMGVQLGCNGTIYILFEPIINEDPNNPVNLLRRTLGKRKDAVVATIFNHYNKSHQTGTCCLFSSDEEIFLKDSRSFETDVQVCLEEKKSVSLVYDDCCVLYQFIPPAIRLVVVGAGNDVQPLSELVHVLGWEQVIVDARPVYATPERFPKADRICRVKPSEVLSAVDIDEFTAVVVMTHSYKYDMAALEQLILTNCRFIGLLGPKKKFRKMVEDLAMKGIKINEETINRIYSPIGLDIGAETSEEIALSILAEIKAVFSNRTGTSLNERIIAIHERSTAWQHE